MSFEFVWILEEKHEMSPSSDNSAGWKGSTMRTYLNGTSDTEKVGLVTSLSNKEYIKKVTKPYLLGYKATVASTDCSDWLWLLSCSEIWAKGTGGATYGAAKAKEGERYKFYSIKNPDGGSSIDNTNLQKGPKGSSSLYWWLRSPANGVDDSFCCVSSTGYSDIDYANRSYGVSPGFSI